MAQVILENIYKSFPHRRGHAQQVAHPGSLSTSANQDFSTSSSSYAEASTSAVSVLRNINLHIKDAEFMVLVGPSGCGKSTLLRLIAGLEPITGGTIRVGDHVVNTLPPKERDIAMVFQNYALYPHMTVYDNLAFGLRRTHHNDDSKQLPADATYIATVLSTLSTWSETLLVKLTQPLPRSMRYWSTRERAIDERVRTVAQMLQVESLLDRLPKQLSGGQKQRVAMGRAMARNPQVFLMDEPLSNLDAKLRLETRAQIVNLQHKLGTTTIYVTHDQTEAMTMGDRIAVMNAGQIQQIATPLELYHHPVNQFVAEFIGTLPMNFIPVMIRAPLLITHPQFRLTLPESWEPQLRRYDGQMLILGIRPEHLGVSVPAPKNLPVVVKRTEILGSEIHLACEFADADRSVLQARIAPDQIPHIGEQLWLAIATNHVHLFDPTTHEAIANTLNFFSI
ncbi:MAG TPA: ABC transporter ATP-binding protein [Elainellaceae cyanobacterium]